MTPARDPKQLSLGALWEEASGGGIMEEASCRRHHAGGIMQGASGGSTWLGHLGWDILVETTWLRSLG